MLETYSYNNVSHTIEFFIYFNKINKYISYVTIDKITTYCHNSKLQSISISLLQKHIRSDIIYMKVIRFCRAALACVDKRYTI